MSRTVFVNPSFANPRRKRRKSRRGKSRRRARSRKPVFRGNIVLRRNAGVAPFMQGNPLILSNPRRRRTRRKNPLELPSVKGKLETVMSSGGGAAVAIASNVLGTSRIQNDWARRAAQVAVAAVGGAMLSKKSAALGGAFAGAAMVAPIQDIAADVLGIGVAAGAGAAAKEADLDALAADLEDVLDEMDDEGLSDDGDEEYAW